VPPVSSPRALQQTQGKQRAYLRGNVLTGAYCMIGHVSDCKTAILLDRAKAAFRLRRGLDPGQRREPGRRVLRASGADILLQIYPSLQAALTTPPESG
jgi:hypothetical protein